jgi:hypothetical protein
LKADKEKAKQHNRNYPTTIKWTYEEMIQLQLRASALGVTRAEYLRLKGLQPIGTIKQMQKLERSRQAAIVVCAGILKEFNRQGVNLNQATKAINSGKLEGRSIDHCLEKINEIRKVNQQILNSIADLRATL